MHFPHSHRNKKTRRAVSKTTTERKHTFNNNEENRKKKNRKKETRTLDTHESTIKQEATTKANFFSIPYGFQQVWALCADPLGVDGEESRRQFLVIKEASSRRLSTAASTRDRATREKTCKHRQANLCSHTHPQKCRTQQRRDVKNTVQRTDHFDHGANTARSGNQMSSADRRVNEKRLLRIQNHDSHCSRWHPPQCLLHNNTQARVDERQTRSPQPGFGGNSI